MAHVVAVLLQPLQPHWGNLRVEPKAFPLFPAPRDRTLSPLLITHSFSFLKSSSHSLQTSLTTSHSTMEPPLPQPPSNETSQFYSSTTGPVRVGSLLLQSVAVTVPTFSSELDLGSIANPQKHSLVKQYLFASLLFKPFLALLLDCFSLAFLSAWVKASLGKGNSSGLVVYALATTGSLAIMVFGGWRARQVLKKEHIQAIYVNREAYRWVCLRSTDKFLFFERVGHGHGNMDALVFFAWFTLRGKPRIIPMSLLFVVFRAAGKGLQDKSSWSWHQGGRGEVNPTALRSCSRRFF